MNLLIRRYVIFLSLIFSPLSFSADYYWSNPFSPSPTFSTALDACKSSDGKIYSTPGSRLEYFNMTSVGTAANPKYNCYYNAYNSNGSLAYSNKYIGYTARSGTGCTLPTLYDPVTQSCFTPAASDGEWCSAPGNTTKTFIMSGGVCVAPTDATLANQCKAYSKSPDSGAAVVTTWKYPTNSSEDLRNPQKAANALGCEIQLLEDISCKTIPPQVDCSFINADGSCHTSEKTMKCRTKSVLTGNVAPDPFGTPAGSLCTGDECEITPPADLKESKPCTYVYDAEGRKSCTSWAFTGKEGAEQCGTVGTTFSCKNDLPKAVGKGLSIATEIEEETLGDGTKKTTKTDTAKQVSCVGQNACTTTTTTNKTVSIHGADGSLQSTTGTCTGALCAGGTSPDGDGDGLGDCTGTDCGDEEGAPIAGPATPELEEQDTYAETTQKFINRAKSSPLVSGISGISMPAGGTCSIGAAQTWFGSIDFSSFCQIAPQILAGLRYLFLAIWAWAAIRLFFTA